MQLEFENNFQFKFMTQRFEPGSALRTSDDVKAWKEAWLKNIEKWHSPYKVLVDFSELQSIEIGLEKDLKLMFKFFEGFFMRSVVGYSTSHKEFSQQVPFEIKNSESEAREAIKIRQAKKVSRGSSDFRSTIQIENHFQQQCMELSFTDPVKLDTNEKMGILRDKLSNNLMQWHSPWNLLIDCANLDYSDTLDGEFQKAVKFFSGFFLQQVIGYSPHAKTTPYPFKVYRARHRAAAELEATGALSGNTANCSSRK